MCFRFYKLHAVGMCEVIPMTVPRKVTCFYRLLFYIGRYFPINSECHKHTESRSIFDYFKIILNISEPCSEFQSCKSIRTVNVYIFLKMSPNFTGHTCTLILIFPVGAFPG